MRSLLRASLLLLLARPGASIAAAQTTIPLRPYLEVLRTVPVVIGGDTLDFLLDTGGGLTVITPAVAERIGCAPTGRATGFRMRGEKVTMPTCDGLALTLGGRSITTEAAIFDLMSLIGPDHPPVAGMVSLRTLAGQAVTLDLAAGTLVLETPGSLRRRTRAMTPLAVRLANGPAGDALDLMVGVGSGGHTLWFLWDSGHIGPVFLAPHTPGLLGLDTTAVRNVALALAPGRAPATPYAIRDIIFDGVLGAPLIARAKWTLDLATGRGWVSDFR